MQKMKVLIIFGSESDRPIYDNVKELLADKYESEIQVISAHRNPAQLEQKMLKNDFDVVIAGAGLSAHLPGVIASKFNGPVFGIPVASRLGGIDAFLSISQMPAGVPVLSSYPEKSEQVVDFLDKIKQGVSCQRVHLVCKDLWRQYEYSNKILENAKNKALELKLEWSEGVETRSDCLNLIPITESSDFKDSANVCAIYFPMMDPLKAKSYSRALDIFAWAEIAGPWVGLNNPVNAVIIAHKLNLLQKIFF